MKGDAWSARFSLEESILACTQAHSRHRFDLQSRHFGSDGSRQGGVNISMTIT